MTTEERLARLETLVAEQKEDIQTLSKKVDRLLEAVHQARGGWLLLLPLGAIVGAVVTWLLPFLVRK